MGELGIDPSPRWSQHRVPSSNTSPPSRVPPGVEPGARAPYARMLPLTPQDQLFTGGIEPPAGGSEPPVLPLHHANRQASARDRTWNARFKVLRDSRFHYRSGASPRIERGGLAPKASRLPLPHDASWAAEGIEPPSLPSEGRMIPLHHAACVARSSSDLEWLVGRAKRQHC